MEGDVSCHHCLTGSWFNLMWFFCSISTIVFKILFPPSQNTVRRQICLWDFCEFVIFLSFIFTLRRKRPSSSTNKPTKSYQTREDFGSLWAMCKPSTTCLFQTTKLQWLTASSWRITRNEHLMHSPAVLLRHIKCTNWSCFALTAWYLCKGEEPALWMSRNVSR